MNCSNLEGHTFAESLVTGRLHCVHCGLILKSAYWKPPKKKKIKLHKKIARVVKEKPKMCTPCFEGLHFKCLWGNCICLECNGE